MGRGVKRLVRVNDQMEQWYALYTAPNAEHHVATRLEEREVTVYLPEIRQMAKDKRSRLVAFFPCYLFMRIDLKQTAASVWRWTPGLRYMVGFEGDEAVVPDQTIALIQRKLEELNQVVAQPRAIFKPGDVVRITDGPLADMVALFEGPSTPAERVTVLLNFLGQANRVRVDAASLEISSRQPSAPPVAEKRPRRTRGRGRRIQTHPPAHTHASVPIYEAH